MARFLLTVWPFQTHLDPFLSVACGLRRRGHEVAFYTGGAGIEEASALGFFCFPFQAVDSNKVDAVVRHLVSSGWRTGNWRDLMLGTVPEQLEDLGRIMDIWHPAVLVCDVAMWGPILVFHETRSEPVALLSHVATCLLPGPENPIPGMNWLIPGFARPLAPWIARIVRAASATVPRMASALRAKYGLPPLPGTVTEFTGSLPLYLVPSTPRFDGNRRDLPPSVRYIGPCLERDNSPDQPAVPAQRNQPTVLVVEGTIYPEQPVLLRAAAQALADASFNVVLVAGKDRKLDSLGLGPLAGNIRLEKWAPLSDLLPFADALLTYGDSETVMAAIAGNVPMVLMPMILDQLETALRASMAGTALVLGRMKRSPASVRGAVKQVLEDPGFRENTRRMSSDFTEFRGGDLAAELLETLAVSRPAAAGG